MTRYRSKIGLEIVLPLLMLMGALSIYLALIEEWVAVCILVLATLFTYVLFRQTIYIIDGRVLIIKVFFLVFKKVDIDTIIEIKTSRNPISAPAASLDRLEVICSNSSVLISPKEKKGFIRELKSLNPNIQLFV